MTLNRNPDNYFTETEQVAFMTSNIVPGIDFSDDPLLQGRNFSYLDTQLSRLGSPNWQELPINRPISPAANYQRDGHMRSAINKGRVSYEPNTLAGNKPGEVPAGQGGNITYPEPLGGTKIRVRSESFGDHYGQARLFWNSMSPVEKLHIVRAQQFELGKVETQAIRQSMLAHLHKINSMLGDLVAVAIGEAPAGDGPPPTDAQIMEMVKDAVSPTTASGGLQHASALGTEGQPKTAKSRKVAILAADGVNGRDVADMKTALSAKGVTAEVVALHLGELTTADGESVRVDKTLMTTPSVVYDAVYVPNGAQSVQRLLSQGQAAFFIKQAYKHGKAIAAQSDGLHLLHHASVPVVAEQGVLDLTNAEPAAFLEAVAQHRYWNRQTDNLVA